jgi:hypothetical protein
LFWKALVVALHITLEFLFLFIVVVPLLLSFLCPARSFVSLLFSIVVVVFVVFIFFSFSIVVE